MTNIQVAYLIFAVLVIIGVNLWVSDWLDAQRMRRRQRDEHAADVWPDFNGRILRVCDACSQAAGQRNSYTPWPCSIAQQVYSQAEIDAELAR